VKNSARLVQVCFSVSLGMTDIGKLAGRWTGAALRFSRLLVIACASKPEAPPAAVRPAAALPNAGHSIEAGTETIDRCALVATVLTEPQPALGGLSAIERPEAIRAKQANGRWVVALSLLEPEGNAPSSLPDSRDCGDRLVLASEKGPWPANVEPFVVGLAPEGDSAFRYVLVLGQRGSSPALSEGRLERDDTGEWRAAGPSKKVPRQLDVAPVESVLPEAIPAGQALAWLELDTGGDTLSVRSLQTGLVLVVQFGTRQLRQVFASCPEGSKGSALGNFEKDVLDRAACGDLFRLSRKGSPTENGRSGPQLVVDKHLPNGSWQPTISLALPTEIRTVRNPSLERSRPHGG
jgi:hypothetical protein